VLTAGHDASKLRGVLSVDVAREGDQIAQMNGALKPLLAGDMVMRDTSGVCCSIIYGQDDRSPISADTSHVLYVAYAPAGVPVDAVAAQLRKIEDNVRLVCPAVVVEQHRVLSA
jgi:DNA/RNA-binding domain of Phe-tRNA-synthetase-like protein